MSEKISLSFVNDGKEFNVPRMTVKKQEIIMEKLVEMEKSLGTKFDYNKEVGKIAILIALNEIDSKVTMENIEDMHPDDFRILFEKFWNNGREIKSEEPNFRKRTR